MPSLRAFASANSRAARTLRRPIDFWSAQAGSSADVLIVLGAALHRNGQMSALLHERVAIGANAFLQGAGRWLLVTGKNEAPTMAKAALALGVPPASVLVEDQAQSTRENAVFCAEIMRAQGAKTALLITQPFHRPRALRCFRKIGVDARVLDFPTETETASVIAREYVALSLYFARGWIGRW